MFHCVINVVFAASDQHSCLSGSCYSQGWEFLKKWLQKYSILLDPLNSEVKTATNFSRI